MDCTIDFFKTYIDSRFYAGHKLDFKQQNCAGGPGSGGGVVGNTNSHQTHLSAPLHGLAAHSSAHQAATHHSHLTNSHHTNSSATLQQQIATAHQQHQQQQQQQQSTPGPAVTSQTQLHTGSALNNSTPNGGSTVNNSGGSIGNSSPSAGHHNNDTHSSASVAVPTSISAPSLPHIQPPNLGLSPQSSADSQQFNIFPAIFSRQLNFSAAGACGQSKLTMDELRPNLVGGLLGLQQGLLEDHAANMQHGGVPQDTKFMSFQDNRLMGISSSHENRLLGLASSVQDSRSPAMHSSIDKNSLNHQRKCSSTPEDFSSLYSGLPTPGIDSSSHHHTPAHTPPTRLSDHTISGNYTA